MQVGLFLEQIGFFLRHGKSSHRTSVLLWILGVYPVRMERRNPTTKHMFLNIRFRKLIEFLHRVVYLANLCPVAAATSKLFFLNRTAAKHSSRSLLIIYSRRNRVMTYRPWFKSSCDRSFIDSRFFTNPHQSLLEDRMVAFAIATKSSRQALLSGATRSKC